MSVQARFRFGAGRPSLDLIRTLRHRGRPDEEEELPDDAAWDAWLTAAGLSYLKDAAPGRAAQARELREQISQLLTTAVDGTISSLPADVLRSLNAAATAAPPSPQLHDDGSLHYFAADPGGAARSLLAGDTLELVGAADLTRLRRCGDPGCRTLFLDTSRPGTRRWCAMNGCGARAKKAGQRARERTLP